MGLVYARIGRQQNRCWKSVSPFRRCDPSEYTRSGDFRITGLGGGEGSAKQIIFDPGESNGISYGWDLFENPQPGVYIRDDFHHRVDPLGWQAHMVTRAVRACTHAGDAGTQRSAASRREIWRRISGISDQDLVLSAGQSSLAGTGSISIRKRRISPFVPFVEGFAPHSVFKRQIQMRHRCLLRVTFRE